MAKITLVDDDENIVTSVSLALESGGHTVQAYYDGASGLAARRAPIAPSKSSTPAVESRKMRLSRFLSNAVCLFPFAETYAARQRYDR